MWALIEQGKILIDYRSTTCIYHNDFSKYMKVEAATLEDIFDYLFDVRDEKFLSEKQKNLFMN